MSTFSPSSTSFRFVGRAENLEVERDGRKAVLQASYACFTARSVIAVALAEAQSVVLPAVPSCHDSTLQLLSSTYLSLSCDTGAKWSQERILTSIIRASEGNTLRLVGVSVCCLPKTSRGKGTRGVCSASSRS